MLLLLFRFSSITNATRGVGKQFFQPAASSTEHATQDEATSWLWTPWYDGQTAYAAYG